MRADESPLHALDPGQLGLRVDLAKTPLTAVMDLVHSTSQTGQLHVEALLDSVTLPLLITFWRGEVTAAAVLDWEGLDALYSVPQGVSAGQAEFWQRPEEPAQPLAPFANLLAEWARLSDEWPRVCAQIGSPSQRFMGEAAPFDRAGGASGHWVTAFTSQPLHEVCSQLAALQLAGFIRPVPGSFEWDALVAPACQDPQAVELSPVMRLLDGHKSLRQLMERGVSPDELRTALLDHLSPMPLFPGSGRALRDWLWERQAQRA